jgi:hypothetical protein
MDASDWRHVMHGGVVMACWGVALFFLRFWRTSRDRLFGLFALAFAVMGLNWLALALVRGEATRYPLFVVRLAAFLIILYAIWDKNRTGTGAGGVARGPSSAKGRSPPGAT